MIHQFNTKNASLIIPQSIGTTEVTAIFDTLGYNVGQVLIYLDTAVASSVPTTMAISEGPTTSAFTAIAALTGGVGAGNFTLPVPNTSTPDIMRFDVDLKPRKRYLKVALASTTARLCSAVAILAEPIQGPNTDALMGCKDVVAA